jgi:uncharacterized protein (TIGR02996 family)
MTDDAFIRAILASPGDDTSRLVYADWLDERDDPRGGFLRAEAALVAAAPADPQRDELYARLLEAAAGIDAGWAASMCRLGSCEAFALVGSWHLEGVSTLMNRPDPDADATVWKANRAAPQHRIAMRGVGYIFRADGTALHESRRDPPLRLSEPLTWLVVSEGGRSYLTLSSSGRAAQRLRIWVRKDGRMLWGSVPEVPNPEIAFLLIRDDPPPTFKGARRLLRPRG